MNDGHSGARNARYQAAAAVAIALLAAAAFGAADQYLGSLFSPFLTAVSGMSAPWLLLPFIVGACQPTRRRAVLLGLAATWFAVGGYVLMIVSPVEGAQLTVREIAITAASQWLWFLGGLITGPLYGMLGYRWRAGGSWPVALFAALPVMLEPAARWLAGHQRLTPWYAFPPADFAEVTAGLALTVVVAVAIARSRTSRPA